ncbi:MAG TPA: precorrin-6A/cobalt-precorrin-6A reductase [Candidatus Omnitrophota bacterium]|nr:precorrin-6A/cobalt-precorrin-6A reductase [Candidatus Omnitrophota bacterium]HPB69208.1 precorrin-6A/cobalt-precorrin-6A reductase [Candidatus Omnitrophota bacterium]HQO57585.1 precorrin-6A/cobalt-precorrin-6A reductase [Candidatus Omnitrophota bacterium]HQP12237.1 precorrin-6A/cobalt-precorrin-6A reductase [Candidatus Omnitrophota bacterium]
MILVIGNTRESSEMVRLLQSQDSVQGESSLRSSYGERVSQGVVFLPRSLNCPMTVHLINKYKVQTVIDAAPIFFKGASQKTMAACREKEIRYIRFEPLRIHLSPSRDIYPVRDINTACEKALSLGKTILLNAGNKHIEFFLKELLTFKKEVVVRVSEPGALAGVITLGIKTQNIIFADRVFSDTFLRSLFKEYKVDVLVTRELGEGHGTAEELKASASEGIPVVLVSRPDLKYPECVNNYDQLLRTLLKKDKRSNES